MKVEAAIDMVVNDLIGVGFDGFDLFLFAEAEGLAVLGIFKIIITTKVYFFLEFSEGRIIYYFLNGTLLGSLDLFRISWLVFLVVISILSFNIFQSLGYSFIQPLSPNQIGFVRVPFLDVPPPSFLQVLLDQQTIVTFLNICPEMRILISHW